MLEFITWSWVKNDLWKRSIQLKKYISEIKERTDIDEWEKELLKNLDPIDLYDNERLNEFEEHCIEIKKRNDLSLKLVFDNEYGELGHHFEYSDRIKLEYINLLIYAYYKEVIDFRHKSKNVQFIWS